MFTIIQADEASKQFIVDAIIDSERSGKDYCFYERAFNLSESQLRSHILNVISKKICGSELDLNAFYILYKYDQPVSAFATWIESKNTLPSNIIKSILLSKEIAEENFRNSIPYIKCLSKITINRTPNTPQIECVYTAPDFRGNGYINLLFDFFNQKYRNDGYKKIELISVRENVAGVKTFQKNGFCVDRITHHEDIKLSYVFPGTGKILWRKNCE